MPSLRLPILILIAALSHPDCRAIGRLVDEALGVFAAGAVESVLTGSVDGIDLAVVHLIGRHQADPDVVMVLVVPAKIVAGETPGILDAAEALGELRLVLEVFELALGERVVVRGMRPAVRACDAKICEQQRGGLGLHRTAAVRVQRKLTRWHLMICDRVVQQGPEQLGAFNVGHTPADHTAAEDVEDDVEIEVGPFRRPHQLRYVPRPDLVGAFRQQFGLLVDRMPQLSTTFADFVVLREEAVHRADRTEEDALIEQRGVDLRRRLVSEFR